MPGHNKSHCIVNKITVLSFILFTLLLSCYFNKEDFTWEEKDCCTWSKGIVYFSDQTGWGDIYFVLPDGTNSYPITLNLQYKGKGTYTCGDMYNDLNGNGHYDPQEPFTDTNGNGCWDLGEEFIDQNGNGFYDSSLAEPFFSTSSACNYDNLNNCVYHCGDEFIDLNGNGHYDPQEPFTDTNGNGCWDPGEPFEDINGNGRWDASLAEPFIEFWKSIKPFSREDMPSCSSDGTTLLFISDKTGYDEIYSMNLSTKKINQLTSDRRGHSYPVFSPDSRMIAYVDTVYETNPPYTGRNQIFIMNADGSGKRQITNDDGGATAPAWSSDGTRIAYIRDIGNEGSIHIVNVDGTGKPVQVFGVLGARGPLSWINNDTEIIYWAYGENVAGIYIAPVNGSYPPYSISGESSHNFNPRVSSDKNSLVFVSSRDGYYELYVSDLSGQFQRRLTNSRGQYQVNSPSFCP